MADRDAYHSYHLIAQIDALDHYRAYRSEGEKKQTEVLASAMERPEISDSDITRDIRYQLGFAAGIAWMLGLPERCKDMINNSLKGGN